MSCAKACGVKDRAEYLTQCCDRERQRADDLAHPMQAIVRVLDARDPNWRSRHHGDCEGLKAAFEVDFIVSEYDRILFVINDYIRVEKEAYADFMRPWWKRLLGMK